MPDLDHTVPRPWRRTAWLLVLAVHVTLLWVYYVPAAKTLAGDERAYRARAERIADGKEVEPGLWPPLYPRLLAPTLTVGGVPLVQLVQTLLLVAVALILRDLARHMVGRGLGPDIAAWLVLAYPPLVAFAHYLWPEILHMALWVTALWIVVCAKRTLPWMAVLGLVLGLAIQSKSLLLGFVPVLAGAVAVGGTAAWRRRVARVAVVAAVLAATLAPTLIANHRALGRWTVATSGWFNLWVGLQDTSLRSLEDRRVHRALRLYEQLGDDIRSRDAALRTEVARYVRETGVPSVLVRQARRQYFRLFDKDSYLTGQLPGGPLARVRQGYAGPPRPATTALRYGSWAAYAAVLLAAVLGLVVWRPRDHPWLGLALGFVVYNLALFLVLHVKSRFRIQMLPCFFLFAGLGVQWLHLRITGVGTLRRPAAWRWTTGALLATLLLLFAFGAALFE